MSAVRGSLARGLGLGTVGGRLSVLGQGAGNAVLNGTALVLNFCMTLILSRLLGAQGFGAYAFALSLVLLVSVFATLGVTPLVVREITTYRLSESWGAVRGMVRRANELVLLTSVTVCAVAATVFVVTGWPRGQLHAPALYALPLIPMIAVTSVRQGVMQGFGRVVLGRSPETVIMPAAALVAAGVLGIALGDRFSASWAVAASDAAGLLAVVVGIVFLRRVLPAQVRVEPPVYETPRWVRAAVPLVMLSLVSTASGQLPTLSITSGTAARTQRGVS